MKSEKKAVMSGGRRLQIQRLKPLAYVALFGTDLSVPLRKVRIRRAHPESKAARLFQSFNRHSVNHLIFQITPHPAAGAATLSQR